MGDGTKENRCGRRVMLSDSVTVGVVVRLVLLAVVAVSGVDGVECYLCSWSNRDLWNMTGLCYPGNFSSDYGIRMDCAAGCEMSFLYNKDGLPTHFYRNCAPANRPITNAWRTIHDDYGHRRMYTCDWHLCNGDGGSPVHRRLPLSDNCLLLLLAAATLTLSSSSLLSDERRHPWG